MLKSDMMAFKAANPHAIFEDFVRWHSPRDWICRSDVIADLQAENAAKEEEGESEVEKRAETVQQIERMAMELGIGRLSERMSSGGGVWRRLWEEAEAVPVVRQRPLVNFHRLAKAVISFLQSLSPAEVRYLKTNTLHCGFAHCMLSASVISSLLSSLWSFVAFDMLAILMVSSFLHCI